MPTFIDDYNLVMSQLTPLAIPDPESVPIAKLKEMCLHLRRFPDQPDVYAAASRLCHVIEQAEAGQTIVSKGPRH
jgi:hypothetical protein